MRRRPLLSAGCASLAAGLWSRAGAAQQAAVIGRIHPGPAGEATLQRYLRGFDEGMRELGHAEGRTYRVLARFAAGDPARLASMTGDLVRSGVDVIVASGSLAVRVARDATRSVPIAMAMSGPDPVGSGLIAGLSRPGGNVTGLTGQTDEVSRKQLALLREVAPRLGEVLVLYNPAAPSQPDAALNAAAAAAGLRLRPVAVARAEDLDDALVKAAPLEGRGLIALPDAALIDRLSARIVALAAKHRLPSVQSFRASVQAGGLLCFGIDLFDMHRRSAHFVDKILKGAQPGELPVEQPLKFEMLINLRTARTLGITIAQSMLLRADEVIE